MNTKKAFELDGNPLPMIGVDPFTDAESSSLEALKTRADQLAAAAKTGESMTAAAVAWAKATDNAAKEKIRSDTELLAKGGDIGASCWIGDAYLTGRAPVPKDEVKGLDYLLYAAHKGFAPAQAKVGRHYVFVTEQHNRALPYLYAAAVQGNTDANLLLGLCFRHGEASALERDPIEALRYLRRAAADTPFNVIHAWERGVAARALAEMYRDGDGVGADRSEAIKWYRVALQNGAEVKTDLANLLKSLGDPSAKQEADNLIASAAKEGNKDAQALLADEKWDKELSAITIGGKKICFWLVQGKVLESEMKSQQHIRSTPSYGNGGPSVYSVTDSWKVLHFEKRNGDHVKLNLPDEAEKVVFTSGERIAVLYAGLDDGTGDATGYPYMLYCLDKKKIIRLRKIAELFKDCGISSRNLFSGKVVWPLAAVASFLIVPFIGIFAAAGFGYLAYKSYKSGGDGSTKLAGNHFDRIESWVYANLI